MPSWSEGMKNLFHPTLNAGYHIFSMLRFKFNFVSKMAPLRLCQPANSTRSTAVVIIVHNPSDSDAGWNSTRIWTPRTQDNSYPGQLVPRTTGTQGDLCPRQLVPRTTRTLDESYPGQLLPKTTRTQDLPRTTRIQDMSYAWHAWHEQLFTDYENSIEYLLIVRNFRHDGHHNPGVDLVKRFYRASKIVYQFQAGNNFIRNQTWVIDI